MIAIHCTLKIAQETMVFKIKLKVKNVLFSVTYLFIGTKPLFIHFHVSVIQVRTYCFINVSLLFVKIFARSINYIFIKLCLINYLFHTD